MKVSWHWHALVIVAAGCIAVVSARPYTGGWNDGSRLATVESLVDYHTWAIDDSIFVRVPPDLNPRPYSEADPALNRRGTCDRLWINGHFYSDKSPAPALAMAGEYWIVQRLTGLSANVAPDVFCRMMTILSSGLAYVVAVWCIFRLGSPIGLDLRWRLALAASFGCATVAATYAEHANNHIVLLAIAAAVTVELAWVVVGHASAWRFALIGALVGMGYTVDLGAGPVLLAATATMIAIRLRRRPWAVLTAGLCAVPFVLLHHVINYSIGGTIGPANAVAEYLRWPGSPFFFQPITGGWNHPSVTRFVLYSLDMLVGKRGIFGHDLPIFLALVTAPAIWRFARRERPLLLHALFWSAGAWLLYGATSTNSSGVCCSIRWLVPLVAPGYFALALVLRDQPDRRADFLILSAWGTIYSGIMMASGPWREIDPLVNWSLVVGAGTTWIGYRLVVSRSVTSSRLIQSKAA
jgi:hypothetical protein